MGEMGIAKPNYAMSAAADFYVDWHLFTWPEFLSTEASCSDNDAT
jgi:hypothetical protein